MKWPDRFFRIAIPAILIVSALGFSSPGLASAPASQVGNFSAPARAATGLDSLLAGTPLPIDLDPSAHPAVPAPNVSPDLSSILGVNIHSLRNAAALDAAKSAGFTWIRVDLDWGDVEHAAGRYDFARYDRLMANLEERSMRALFILDYGNPPFTGGWDLPPTTPDAIQAFGDFAGAAARHFAGLGAAYEVWNEPNISRFWPPQPDAAQYAALASQVIARLHAGDPSAKVTTAGLSSTDFSFLRSYLGLGGGAGADAIGIHPYGYDLPEAFAGEMAVWRSIVAGELAADPPTWVTEWGYSSTEYGDGHSPEAQAQQAVMVTRELLTAWSAGFPLIIYYDLRNDGPNPSDPEQNFGLLSEDYSPKPAMQAVKTLTSVARGRQLVGIFPLQAPGLHALELNGPAGLAAVVWADSGRAALSVPPGTTATNLLGAPLSLRPLGARLSLAVSGQAGPVYLYFPQFNEPATR